MRKPASKTTKATTKPAAKVAAKAPATKAAPKKPVTKKTVLEAPAKAKAAAKKSASKEPKISAKTPTKRAVKATGKAKAPAKSPKQLSIEQKIAEILSDRKAEDIITIDLANKADFADSMVIASGTSSRHVIALAEHLIESLKGMGMRTMVEGLDVGDWVLVDAGDTIVHLFKPETRVYYRLEKMWSVPGSA